MSIGGISACLVSPFSWHHHWVWLVPLVVCLVDLGAQAGGAVKERLGAVGVAGWFTGQTVMLLTLGVIWVAMIPFCSHQISVRLSFIGQPALAPPFTEMWVLWGCLLVLAFAVPGGSEALRQRRARS